MGKDWHQLRWEKFRREVQDKGLRGPQIVWCNNSQPMSDGIDDTGYHFKLIAPQMAMSAPILREKKWGAWPLEDLYLHPDHVMFSFNVYPYGVPKINGKPLLKVSSALTELYCNSCHAKDLIHVLASFEPLLPPQAQTTLKSGCQNYIAPELKDEGFAVADIIPQQDSIRVRLVWLFPSSRSSKRNRYLRAGSIRLKQEKGDIFSFAEFVTHSSDLFCTVIRNRLVEMIQGKLENIFSDKGKERIMDKFLWSKGIPSPQSASRQVRLKFAAANRDLWTDLRLFAKTMRDEGLYSSKRALSDIESSCRSLIREIQEEVS
ncbi:MAG: hypothetical protein K9M54_06175 [Kiritimatiellales bacterium]|nr:hypothetical protein [Kiritimatiellales bacterium]